MSIPDNLKSAMIFSRVFDFCLFWHQRIKKFPKLDRYSLGQECFKTLIEIVVMIRKTEYLPTQNKIMELWKAGEKIDSIKIFVRLARKTEALNEQEYISMESELTEIGRMIGGWIRSLKNPEKKP